MSTVKTDTLTGTTTAGSIAVTGEGNSTTTNLQQGLCKVWIDLNGETFGARDSFNVSGQTDNGTGDYTVTINNDMGSANYSFNGYCGDPGATINHITITATGNKTASSVRFSTLFTNNTTGGGSADDSELCDIQIHGDLA
jgi:hemolysin activation/secretion protein